MKLDIRIVKDSEVTDLVLCDLVAHRRVRARKLVPYRLVSAACLKQSSTAMEA